MVLIAFKDLYKILIFPKFHGCSSKIVPATPFWNSNFKWAWQAQFLSHNLLSLQNCLSFTNKQKQSLKDLHKIHIFPKFHRCGSKIVPATPFWNLNFKWAWQAQFLSHTYETLEKYVFYIDLEMILVPFFKINDRIWDKNFGHSCHIHILSHPWLRGL